MNEEVRKHLIVIFANERRAIFDELMTRVEVVLLEIVKQYGLEQG